MSKEVLAAMGSREGDYITIKNKWHKVSIEVEDGKFFFSGDFVHGQEKKNRFGTITEALTAAWNELALYERGRCD